MQSIGTRFPCQNSGNAGCSLRQGKPASKTRSAPANFILEFVTANCTCTVFYTLIAVRINFRLLFLFFLTMKLSVSWKPFVVIHCIMGNFSPRLVTENIISWRHQEPVESWHDNWHKSLHYFANNNTTWLNWFWWR